MTEKPINLNRFRKDKARADKRARGSANAVKHGRTKAQKALEDARAAKIRSDLDGHLRDEDPGPDPDQDGPQ